MELQHDMEHWGLFPISLHSEKWVLDYFRPANMFFCVCVLPHEPLSNFYLTEQKLASDSLSAKYHDTNRERRKLNDVIKKLYQDC